MSNGNLLVICNSFPNHDDTYAGNIFVKEQVKCLSRYFDSIYVVSPVAYGMDRLRRTKHSDYQFDNVQVFFPRYFNNPLFWRHGKAMWAKLEARAIDSLIKKKHLQFKLIHAHFTWPSGAVAVKLKQIYSSPIIITEHTSTTIQKAIETKDAAFINAWSGANSIIRVNRSDVKSFERVGIPLSKVVSIPNGYDQNRFHPMDARGCRAVLNLPQDRKIILYVGNLYGEVKGHKYLIDAVSKIVTERKNVLCVIVGAGKLRTSLERQIRLLGLEDYIRLAGGKPYDEIPLWMNACDLFVLPSLRESFGVVQIEAMACGKPIVATKNGGSEEIVTSEEYGLLAEPANSEDLAEKLLVALDREWDRGLILANAKQYTWECIVEEIMSVYTKVMV